MADLSHFKAIATALRKQHETEQAGVIAALDWAKMFRDAGYNIVPLGELVRAGAERMVGVIALGNLSNALDAAIALTESREGSHG